MRRVQNDPLCADLVVAMEGIPQPPAGRRAGAEILRITIDPTRCAVPARMMLPVEGSER
jgi:hypothetical protein